MEIILICLLSYLSGSIPFGLILTKFFFNKDIRKFGSGNIGATNVLRTTNKFLATTTLLLDVFKGYIPVILTKIFFPEYIQISALLVFLGHVFPIWLKFNGGKGVATYLGVLIAFSYELSILFIFTWMVISLIFKYSSVSSIFGTLTVYVVTFLRETAQMPILKIDSSNNLSIILFIFFILILFTHRKNISNLKNKKEKKIKL